MTSLDKFLKDKHPEVLEEYKQLVNTMKEMMDDDFYNRDNMFDNAIEFDIPLSDISICKSKSFTDLTQV